VWFVGVARRRNIGREGPRGGKRASEGFRRGRFPFWEWDRFGDCQNPTSPNTREKWGTRRSPQRLKPRSVWALGRHDSKSCPFRVVLPA